MRDTIFISHATPEDNEFTIWLASRLELLGYKVWIDKKELLGGEAFWKDIEKAITEKAIKVLLVYSKNIITESGHVKVGIQKEIDLTINVLNDNPDLRDFLIFLHLDDAPFSLFEGSKDLNQIPFMNNWAEGLEVLLKKLVKDSVPTFDGNNNFAQWYLEHYLIKNPIVEKKELYYTNWWNIEHLPKQFYIYRFKNKQLAKTIYDVNKHVISTLNANCIISFEKNLIFEILHENETVKILPTDSYEIKVSDILFGLQTETFPTQRDAENYFKKLLRRVIHILFRNIKLNWSELSNKNLAYYHTIESLPTSKFSFSYPHRTKINQKKKNLHGKYLTIGKWHFGISIKPTLSPYLGFSLKSHIIFTSDGMKAFDDKDLIHSYRRKKGKRMFNEEWRDLLLAFISSLKNANNEIFINVATNDRLVMKNNVELFWSKYGYYDPKDIERQSLFSYEDEEEETEDVVERINDGL